MSMNALDVLGTQLGTDKGSIGQGYLDHYERNLAQFRGREFNLLEIGVAQGASLEMWKKYFPEATIIGIDINPECLRFAGEGVIVEIGSQGDSSFLNRIGTTYKPSVVIDDGSHLASHNMETFFSLFPHLRPGGLYVIEDLYLHYTRPNEYRDVSDRVPSSYFAKLAEKLTSEEAGVNSKRDEETEQVEEINRIEFIRRGILIEKKLTREAHSVMEDAWPLVGSSNSANMWHVLSAFILRNSLDLEKAAEAARNAITLAPSSSTHHVRLADVLERQGKIAEAMVEARAAFSCAPEDGAIRRLIERLAILSKL